MSAEMTQAEAAAIWNNLNRMDKEDFGGEYPFEVIEQACEAGTVLGIMYKQTIDGEVHYSLTESGRNRELGEDA
jgi:hypothetical protein